MQLVTVLTIIRILCGVNGNMVNLTPSPEASVQEGKTLDLRCYYTGSSVPHFINWYLNNDTVGLVINVTNCSYKIKPERYELYRLKTSCNITISTLSIVNISIAKDNGAKWECDYTIFDGLTPSKASTTIKVKEAGTSGDSGSGGSGGDGGIAVPISVGIVVFLTIVAIVTAVCVFRKKGYTAVKVKKEVKEESRTPIKRMLCHKQPDPHKDSNEQELEDMMKSV